MTEQRPNGEVNPVEQEDRREEAESAGPGSPAGYPFTPGDADGGPDERAGGDSGVAAGGSEPPREPEQADEEDAAERLRAERNKSRDQHLRLAADFDNYRKRTEDRLRQRWNSAQADLLSRFLDPLDDLLRVTALEPETASVEAIVEGVDLVERKFFRVLEDIGVEIVDPAGETFDPNTMEAMMQVPAESEDDDETVAQVFQRGYAMKGLLVRPARVSVYKA